MREILKRMQVYAAMIRQTFFLLCSLMLATQLSSATVKAYTEDGQIVVLDTETMSWDYFKDKLISNQRILFSNDELRITNYGVTLLDASMQNMKPNYKVSLKLEALNPTKILFYKTHRLWFSDDGSNSGYIPVGIMVFDNFGNQIKVCEASINGHKSVMFDNENAVYPRTPVNMEIGICAKLLEGTKHLEIKMRNVFDFSNSVKSGSLPSSLNGNEITLKVPINKTVASFSP